MLRYYFAHSAHETGHATYFYFSFSDLNGVDKNPLSRMLRFTNGGRPPGVFAYGNLAGFLLPVKGFAVAARYAVPMVVG